MGSPQNELYEMVASSNYFGIDVMQDGHLRVFEWPSLKIVLDQPDAHKSIKDMDFR
jgi:hypothetical protein